MINEHLISSTTTDRNFDYDTQRWAGQEPTAHATEESEKKYVKNSKIRFEFGVACTASRHVGIESLTANMIINHLRVVVSFVAVFRFPDHTDNFHLFRHRWIKSRTHNDAGCCEHDATRQSVACTHS